jgi:hypothetical protein
MWRCALVALALGLAAATVPVVQALDLRDDRLPRNEAEKRLTQRLGAPIPFSCKPTDEDASLAIPDADYFCQAGDVGYWIAPTNGELQECSSPGRSPRVRACSCSLPAADRQERSTANRHAERVSGRRIRGRDAAGRRGSSEDDLPLQLNRAPDLGDGRGLNPPPDEHRPAASKRVLRTSRQRD